MEFGTVSILFFLATAVQAVTASALTPPQTVRTERPCWAACTRQENCYEGCVVEECGTVCQSTESVYLCLKSVGRDELSSELGYFEFKEQGGEENCGGTNPVLGIKKGTTYFFTQRHGSCRVPPPSHVSSPPSLSLSSVLTHTNNFLPILVLFLFLLFLFDDLLCLDVM